MASIATVTTRDFAILDANTPPPISIWLSSQPPKISPLALVSAGIASVRMQRSPPGSVSVFSGALLGVSVMRRLQERHDVAYRRRGSGATIAPVQAAGR